MAGGPPPPRGRRDDRVRENPTPTNVLGVFGLSLHTHDEDLEKLFSQYGRIESCKIIYDHWTRKSRGFGFITFSDQAGATAARDELNGTYLHDRPMRVDYSLTKRAHSPTPGRYMGQDVDRQRSDRDRGGYRRDEYRGGRDRDRDYDRRRREPSYSPPRRRRSPSPPRRRRSPSYDSPR
ncbi:transformer 2b [Phlyctochytrium arcticum]|nr:transformer 2b [Phlyctochytrium arcticum]